MSLLNDVLAWISGSNKIIKPIPDREFNDNNNVALQRYYENNFNANNAKATPVKTNSRQVTYSQSLANGKPNPAKFAKQYQKAFGELPPSSQYQAPTATPTAAPVQTMVLGASTSPQGNLWDQFVNRVMQTAPARGYDPEIIIKQKALESGFGTSDFARNRNNFGGIGAYDSNPNNAFEFPTIDDYLNYYYNLIQNRYPNAYENRQNPKKYVEGLKQGGYASDKDYVWKVLNTPLQPR